MRTLNFIIGSGLSKHAGYPGVQDLTKFILKGEGVFQHSDNCFYLYDKSKENPHSYIEIDKIVKFIKVISSEIEGYYKNLGSDLNYEQIYYVIEQLYSSELEEYENPIAKLFVDKLINEVKIEPIRTSTIRGKAHWTFHEQARIALNYIKDIVWHKLNLSNKNTNYLSFFDSLNKDNNYSKVNLFTLNHDTLLEYYFDQNKIVYIDGFGKPINKVRYYNKSLFNKNKIKYNLFKLHGSINWFSFRTDHGSFYDERIGIPLDGDIWHTKDPNGKLQMPLEGRPLFLAGTFNKLFDYNDNVYADLQAKFIEKLDNSDQLIVIGYSFGDKGINTKIINWLYHAKHRKIVVVHPNPNNLKNTARGSFSNKWDNLIRSNKLVIINKKIEDCTWKEVKKVI